MARSLSIFGFLLAFVIALPEARAQTQPTTDGPAIEVAPEHTEAPAAPSKPTTTQPTAPRDETLVRGIADEREKRTAESGTSLGGYGEIHLRGTKSGKNGEREWVADIPRLVIFLMHQFNDSVRFYSELEVEHTLSCSTCPGAFEVEQAMIDWKLAGDAIAARAGLILIPMGIINQWHEPPIFHGVVRPKVDTVVIPSTWRDLGAGFFGKPTESLRYEVYALSALNPMKINAGGLAGARMGGAIARADAWALTARLEWEPLLGAVLGSSIYYSDMGKNGDFYDSQHAKLDLSVPLIGWDIDARFRRSGFEWRVVFAEWHLPESGTLMATRDQSGKLLFDPMHPVPTRMRGAYVEGAYDVLHPLGSKHQLLPFARLEYYNTQSAVPDGYQEDPTYSVREYTFGLTYRPIRQIVFKADYQLRNRRLGLDETQLNFGMGFMY
jgi:hypothetical protein